MDNLIFYDQFFLGGQTVSITGGSFFKRLNKHQIIDYI